MWSSAKKTAFNFDPQPETISQQSNLFIQHNLFAIHLVKHLIMIIDRQVSNTRYFNLQAANEPDLPWFELNL